MWKELCICCPDSMRSTSRGTAAHQNGVGGPNASSSPYHPSVVGSAGAPANTVFIEPLPSVDSLNRRHHQQQPQQQATQPTVAAAAAARGPVKKPIVEALIESEASRECQTAVLPPPPPSAVASVRSVTSDNRNNPLVDKTAEFANKNHLEKKATGDQKKWTTFDEKFGEENQQFHTPPQKPVANTVVNISGTGKTVGEMKVPPAPLHIDASFVPEPTSTTAKYEEWKENSAKARLVSIDELAKIPENQRADLVYQFLLPEEIIDRKEQLEAQRGGDNVAQSEGKPNTKPVPSPINVPASPPFDDEHSTARDYAVHEEKRQEFFKLTDEQLVNMPLVEVESYYSELTAEEIMDVTNRLNVLKESVKEGKIKVAKTPLSRKTTSFLESLKPSLSLRSENGGFIDDEIVPEDVNALSVRDVLLDASDEEIISISDEMLKKLQPLLSINEMEDLVERKFLIEASRKAKALTESD